MNKLLPFLFALFLLSFSATAQKVLFTDTSNVWNEKGFDNRGSGGSKFTSYDRYYYKGDTLINGLVYKILYNQSCKIYGWSTENSTYRSAYLREDTTGVYKYISNSAPTETVFYKQDWQVGDTTIEGGYKKTVASIDSVLINNVSHKVWNLSRVYITYPSTRDTISIIEGIGANTGVLMPGPFGSMFGNQLICFKTQGNTPTLSKSIRGFDNQTTCGLVRTCTTGIEETNEEKEGLPQVIPNPADVNSYIKLPGQLQTGTVSIYNNYGQLVVREKIEHTERWTFRNKITVPGIYFYRISSSHNGINYSGRFVFE